MSVLPERTDERLVRAAMQVRAASPQAFADLLAAINAHAADARDRILSAPLADLPNAQGRAQSLHALVKALQEAPTSFDRMVRAPQKVL